MPVAFGMVGGTDSGGAGGGSISPAEKNLFDARHDQRQQLAGGIHVAAGESRPFVASDRFSAAGLMKSACLGWYRLFGLLDKRPSFAVYAAGHQQRGAALHANGIGDSEVGFQPLSPQATGDTGWPYPHHPHRNRGQSHVGTEAGRFRSQAPGGQILKLALSPFC